MPNKCKNRGLSYFEHWIADMEERREAHLEEEGADASLLEFKAWHKQKYGYGTQYGVWQENETDRFLVEV